MNTKIYDWLMDNADAPIRYRVAREILKDEKAAKAIESELFNNLNIQKWLTNLKSHNPPQHHSMVHGSFDFCLENSMPKCAKLGLHGEMPQMKEAAWLYLERIKGKHNHKPVRELFNEILIANFLTSAGYKDDDILKFMLKSLDVLYSFAKENTYDIYLTSEERAKLKGVPKRWRDTEYFIFGKDIDEKGFYYPLVYDIIGLSGLYVLNDPETDNKINTIIKYISTDDFHEKISDGYGIIVVDSKYESGGSIYHGMGWDPKYPGWFDLEEFANSRHMPKLLFYAEFAAKYPSARKTKWFAELLSFLNHYKTDADTYIFPDKWLKESQGYANQGHHMSFGENRRKKVWCEIESTFYMQLLQQ